MTVKYSHNYRWSGSGWSERAFRTLGDRKWIEQQIDAEAALSYWADICERNI